jgi:Ca-activated chloride channel family protein
MSGTMRASIAIGAVAVLIGGTLGITHVIKTSAGGCGSSPITLNVAVAPAIAPSVRSVAAAWQRTNPTVDGACIRVAVASVPPGVTANELVAASGEAISTGLPATKSFGSATPPASPAVWIPDSTAWLNRVQGVVSAKFGATAQPSLASSPVVLGIVQADAAKLRMTSGTVSTKAFEADLEAMRVGVVTKRYPLFQLGLAEPRNDATGLAGAATLAALDLGTEASPGGPYGNIVADYRMASPNAEVATDSSGLIKAFTVPNTSFKGHASPQMTAAILSEQSILAFDATNPATPIEAVRLGAESASLDYPVAMVAGVSAPVAQAATLFRAEITKPSHQQVFATAGFRTPAGAAGVGFPAAHGATPRTVAANPIKITSQSDDAVAGALALWSAANTKSRVLVLFNAASSMKQPSVYPGHSRLQLTQAAATAGLGLFTIDSELGNWAFAPGLGQSDYQQVVPVKQLDVDNQASVINHALGTATTVPGSGCGLYSALDAAYKNMLDNYEAGKINTVVVFTDCSSANPHGKSLKALTNDIASLANASKPVPVVLINVGPKSNDAGLAKISQVVGGQPLDLKSPQDIVNVFLQAVVAVGPGS